METSIRQVLAENIRALMALSPGMTITSLAKDVGISRGQMNNIVTQKSAITIDTLDKLAAVLDSNAASLLFPASLLLVDAPQQTPDKKTHYFSGVQKERETLIEEAATTDYRENVDKLARHLLKESFYQTDDEGKLALLRVAISMLGWSPDLEGYKMPRDWRDLAEHVATDWGWYDNMVDTPKLK